MPRNLEKTQPCSVTPSDVARFIGNWHVTCCPGGMFTTAEFAGYFDLTTQQAQEQLNGYAEDSLLTYNGLKDGIESWKLSRDGGYVFFTGFETDNEKVTRLRKGCADKVFVCAD